MILRAASASGARASMGLNQCRNTKLVALACQLAMTESCHGRGDLRRFRAMAIEFRILGPGDTAALDRVADDVFDNAVQAALAHEFLNDSRHHIAVAIDEGVVVGFAS